MGVGARTRKQRPQVSNLAFLFGSLLSTRDPPNWSHALPSFRISVFNVFSDRSTFVAVRHTSLFFPASSFPAGPPLLLEGRQREREMYVALFFFNFKEKASRGASAIVRSDKCYQ